MTALDAPALAREQRPLQLVAQLAQVARPPVADERADGLRRERRGFSLADEGSEDAASQRDDVSPSLAQRGHAHGQHAHAIVEILAELALSHAIEQVMVRRNQDPHVRLSLARVADAPVAVLLDDLEELGLDREVHVANLVQEQRAAVCDLQEPRLGGDRPRERPLLVAEELGVHQLAGEARTVEIHERAVRPGSVTVEPRGEHALPRPGLALDQHRALGAERLPRRLGQTPNRAALADEGLGRGRPAPRPARRRQLRRARRRGQHRLEQRVEGADGPPR